jgi:hypothetical protein
MLVFGADALKGGIKFTIRGGDGASTVAALENVYDIVPVTTFVTVHVTELTAVEPPAVIWKPVM